MSGLFKRKEETPTPEELARIEGNENVRTQEATDFDPTQINRMREFSDKVLEDGTYEIFFQPYIVGKDNVLEKNPYYSEAYQPLYLFFSRSCRLGKMSERDTLRFKSRVHRAAQASRRLTSERREHLIIRSMEDYLATVVPAQASDGFFMRTLFEIRKTFNMLTGNTEKRKGWRLW